MATGTEKGVEAVHGPAACYRELSRFPAVTRAALRAAAGGQTFLLYTECSRPDLARRRLLRFGRHYSLRRTAGREGLAVSRTALSAEIHSQLLSQDSPTGQRRAVLKRCPRQGHELLEVWDSGGCSHSVDLTALGKHEDVYTEGPFACLAWSHSETRLLYVAEKSRPKRQPPCPWDVPGAAWPAAEDEDEEGKQFVYHEDWGEALSTRSMPVLCVLDLEGLSLSVLQGVPEDLCPGQALWSPDDRGVVFVGWWHKPFRLGLNACSNRRSGIFHLDLASGCCGERWGPGGCPGHPWDADPLLFTELLSAENGSVCSPRLSPDGQHLLYLEGVVGGPHRQCLRLRMLTWQTRQTVTVLDVVQEPTEAFTGLYAEVLPPRCWAADSRRAVLGTPQRSRTDLLLVDTETCTVTNLTAGSSEGCWELLTLQWDLLVATCSAPHHPPCLVVAVLPPAGQELPLGWVPVEDTPTVPGVTWKTLTVQPPCSGQGPTAQDTQAFEALLLSPSDGTPPHPLVVCPHGECGDSGDTLAVLVAPQVIPMLAPGGPHAVFDARWRPSMAALCQLGFAVLLVNYRGSLGFGQASISSLLSRVGEQDVADTQVRGTGLRVLGGCCWEDAAVWVPMVGAPWVQLAVEQALHREPLDPHRLALLAGSHGAFIALHLLTREPERYQACALRSPVCNLPALLGTSDIPDWRYTSLGLPYSFERVPCADEVATMLLRSPIAQAAQAAVVPRGWPRTGWCGDRGRCLQELCALAPPAPGAAQAGWDRPAQPLVPTVVLGYASPRVTAGPGDHTRTRGRWSQCSQGHGCGLGFDVK
ncbi:acylamino-acid-releasing enzyme-like isoform X2 [Vidua chalybeata]|uniref:acylamino-acid-releasing enzyme-like isoform X2 n=1 Tax=Vidua chalybeata TaxID=81927 RepID=UPI0023A85BD9|nr:acylamino-acid-releasing enzyme-like isoform X2 [Vidua chalybeata]